MYVHLHYYYLRSYNTHEDINRANREPIAVARRGIKIEYILRIINKIENSRVSIEIEKT